MKKKMGKTNLGRDPHFWPISTSHPARPTPFPPPFLFPPRHYQVAPGVSRAPSSLRPTLAQSCCHHCLSLARRKMGPCASLPLSCLSCCFAYMWTPLTRVVLFLKPDVGSSTTEPRACGRRSCGGHWRQLLLPFAQ
jgi:hypothetical protein